jgi:dolichol-phosphate mannosyltransferase
VRLVVCVPTYNERENLEPMLKALGGVLEEQAPDGRVLVIDDNSPDGTGAEADRLAEELPFVDVLHRERKEGLGPAYVAGFRRALAARAELVAQIDCDFSHDPADLPRLLAGLERSDVALGSRYASGGGTRSWSLLRRAVSRTGALYARLLLGIPVRDPTSGFKVYRRPVLEAIDLDRVTSRGYAFQIEVVFRALQAGFTVTEVPIVFTDRREGGSKMGPGIVLEAVTRVPALRLAALRGRL